MDSLNFFETKRELKHQILVNELLLDEVFNLRSMIKMCHDGCLSHHKVSRRIKYESKSDIVEQKAATKFPPGNSFESLDSGIPENDKNQSRRDTPTPPGVVSISEKPTKTASVGSGSVIESSSVSNEDGYDLKQFLNQSRRDTPTPLEVGNISEKPTKTKPVEYGSVIESSSASKEDGYDLNQIFEIGTLGDILSKLHIGNSRKVTSETAKSSSGPIAYFPVNVDLAIAFAYYNAKKRSIIISKGARKVVDSKTISLKEWHRMREVKISADSDVRVLGDRPLLIMLVSNDIEHTLANLLSWLNNVVAAEYPLLVGFDDSREISSITPLFLLSSIQNNLNLYFFFYSYGLRMLDMNYLEIKGNKEIHPFPVSDKLSYYYNSMVEIRNVLAEEDENVLKNFRSNIMDQYDRHSFHSFCKLKSLGIEVWNNNKGLKLTPYLDQQTYSCAFSTENGGQFVYSGNNEKFPSEENFLFVSKKTETRLNQLILKNLSAINILKVPFPNILWVNGVPGSGKTYYLIHSHSVGKDLILTLTKEGCLELRNSVENLFGVDKATQKENYRTLASLLVNGSKRTFSKVIIDEALLMHAGLIGYVVALTGANCIELVGDEWQIPFVDRETTSKSKYSSPRLFAEITTSHVLTRRCPIDVCYALSLFYPGIHTINNTVLSMIKLPVNESTLRNVENTLFLTLTQKEKTNLQAKGIGCNDSSKLLTVHEAQGQTFEHVILVRLNNKHLEIYNSIEHAIVAISRHTLTFKYLSSVGEDMVSKLISNVMVSNVNLPEWNAKQKLRYNMGMDSDQLIKKKPPSNYK